VLSGRQRDDEVVSRCAGVALTVLAGLVSIGTAAAPAGRPQPCLERALSAAAASSAKVSPIAASFISAERGCVLGQTSCRHCSGLVKTIDGGASWTALPKPPVSVTAYPEGPGDADDVAFADRRDGYLFGPGLMSTHDGGSSWTPQHLAPVVSLQIGSDDAFALSVAKGLTQLWKSSVAFDDWATVPLPAAVRQSRSVRELEVRGETLVLLLGGNTSANTTPEELGALWSSSDGGTTWHSQAVPCRMADHGAALVAIALGHPGT
jgi:hypothetical protein